MKDFERLLSGGDLRSIGKNNSIAKKVKDQVSFDELFKCLFHKDRHIVMRTADVVEKITINYPQYLFKHKKKILELLHFAQNKELKWHLALLIPRLHLNNEEFDKAWKLLTTWTRDQTNSRIVRVNSIQGLFEMMKQRSDMRRNFTNTIMNMQKENIPSIKARIKKLCEEKI